MFNRNARRYTATRTPEPERFGGDEYAAKWLTDIYHPEFGNTIRVAYVKESPKISCGLAMCGWSDALRGGSEAEEVF